jgi:tetratricopeptide (TPR) repeat protein
MSARRLVWSIVLALLAFPSTASAQRERFFDALARFHTAAEGAYGDEGNQLAARLDEMAAALTAWDTAIRDAEREWQPQLKGADAQTALQIHTLLGSLYTERSRFADARQAFEAATRIEPKRAAFHTFTALVHQAAGRPSEAADAFRIAWTLEPDDPLLAYRLLVHRSAQATVAELERALATLARVERELVRGARRRAQDPFVSVNAIDDDARGAMLFAPASYARGLSLLLEGRYEAALAALREAVAADPLVADRSARSEPMAQGINDLRQGRVRQAIERLETAVLRSSDSSEVHRILGIAYAIDGNVEQSLDHLREAVRINPTDERSWRALARALDDSGNWVEAVQVLRQGIAALPDSGNMRWELSATSGKLQRTDEADLDLIARADRLVLLAGRGDLYSRVARLAQHHLDYSRALELLEQYVALRPNEAAAHKALGQAYIEQGREDRGYAELVVALLLDTADAETLTAIGRLHLTAEQYASAVEALERAVVLGGDDRQATHALGTALIRGGRTAEGQQVLDESERLQTRALDDQRRLRTAGMLKLTAESRTSDGNFDAAIETWQEVIALERGVAANHLRLAEVLVKVKRLEEAAGELQTAISLKAGPDARRRLADVYAAMGRTGESARERELYVEERMREHRGRAGETGR